MKSYDGKAWWQQPWWRKAIYWIALAATFVAVLIWGLTRKRAVRRNVEEVLADPMNRAQSPEQWAADKAAIEAERQRKIDEDTAKILAATATKTIEDFKKRFGRDQR